MLWTGEEKQSLNMLENKKNATLFCQNCERKIEEWKISKFSVSSEKLCESCEQEAKTEEEYRDLPRCNFCHKPVYEEEFFFLESGELIHEGCLG